MKHHKNSPAPTKYLKLNSNVLKYYLKSEGSQRSAEANKKCKTKMR